MRSLSILLPLLALPGSAASALASGHGECRIEVAISEVTKSEVAGEILKVVALGDGMCERTSKGPVRLPVDGAWAARLAPGDVALFKTRCHHGLGPKGVIRSCSPYRFERVKAK